MVYVQGGTTFTMGNGTGMMTDFKNHPETVSSFAIAIAETTKSPWNAASGNSERSNYPVADIKKDDISAYIGVLNEKTGMSFRLPTDAEWQNAAMGSKKSKGFVYSGSNTPGDVAWYSGSEAHEVGQKNANELGIYDMSGNVQEVCQYWVTSHKANVPEIDPCPINNSPTPVRGGRYNSNEGAVQVKNSRYFVSWNSINSSFTGFRLAL